MTEFGVLNLEEMQGEGTRLNRTQENFLDQFVPMPQGKGSVVIRLLPPMKGHRLFQYTRIHNINERKVHCPRPLIFATGKWDNKVDCPICGYYNALWRKIDMAKKNGGNVEALMKEARSLKPIERYYYNAIVRSMTVEGEVMRNVGPRILSVGKILHHKIVAGMVGDENRKGLGDVTDIKTGYDFVIKKTLKGEFADYAESGFVHENSPLGTPEEIKKWCGQLHDLAKLRSLREVAVLEKEVAIHRRLIKDDTVGFNVEAFDARWQPAMDEETPEAASGAVATGSAPVELSTAPVVEQDLSIEDEDFLKDIEALRKQKS